MELKWYGHSAFLITLKNGLRILTDPCAPTTGYSLSGIPCDIITSSHAHFDHNYMVAAAGAPEVLAEPGTYRFDGLTVRTVSCFHDDCGGAKRGQNLIFVYESEGLRIAHFGDLGHTLSDEQLEEIGPVDVMLCPVGGTYTVDGKEALALAGRIRPRIFVPMHYQTDKLTLSAPLAGLEDFLRLAENYSIHRLNGSECTVTVDTLPEKDRVLVFDYAEC